MKTNARLHQDVMDELSWEPTIKEGRIGITVKDGVVTLSGFVESFSEKVTAERAVKRVEGVTAVVNNVDVDLPSSAVYPDEEIARAALSALKWTSNVPKDRFKVIVEKGKVTLEGTADWQFQKAAAERAVSSLSGVRSVLNLITVKPQLVSSDIRTTIESALKRHAERQVRRISILTAGDEVTLRGEVDSFSDKEAAEGAAWGSPGVRLVHDELRINPRA